MQEKLTIGQGICTPLLKKIRADLQRNIEESGEETVNRLNPRLVDNEFSVLYQCLFVPSFCSVYLIALDCFFMKNSQNALNDHIYFNFQTIELMVNFEWIKFVVLFAIINFIQHSRLHRAD